MEFVPLSLALGERIDGIRTSASHKASSHAFVSLYLWKESMGLSVAFSENAFLIRSKDGYFFPCGKEDEILFFLESVWKDEPLAKFLYAREEDVLLVKRVYGERVDAAFDAASREYLYLRTEQIAMSGKKFTYQRAKVNKAKRLGEIRSAVIDASLIPTAKSITLAWADGRDDEGDKNETLEALEHFDALGLYGNLLYLDEKPIGFNLGSFLCEDTFDIHIAKTLVDDVDTLMKLYLYQSLPEKVAIINREEDLGIRGLAIHKQDAQPCGFNDTYILSLKDE